MFRPPLSKALITWRIWRGPISARVSLPIVPREIRCRSFRLLILSSPHQVGLERLDRNDRVMGTVELLRRTIGEQVTVSLMLSPDPCPTLANPGDVDNAILNLAINARDAMPGGGRLMIKTHPITLDADVASRIAHARRGDYVVLTVSDTGHGMSPEVLEHAMEPFFTTKEPGKGTGLGLATVHTTVQQLGGFVGIDSIEGEGTSIHLYFPKAEPGPIVSLRHPLPGRFPWGMASSSSLSRTTISFERRP